MPINNLQAQVISKCKSSVIFFISNFCKVKHPSAGIIPFNTFNYQRQALKAFRDNRFVIFKKCRQSGLSTISGAFALWYAMFANHKTILIVSRTDSDAKSFLRENVVFPFRHLPIWMQELWKPLKDNEHEFFLPNGSIVRSLTSHQDVLRSNASSLNIIDEAAFIENMGVAWAAGWPTLIHGGSTIVISTVTGVGTWYWSTWVDAEAGLNTFHPINIDWWDMDWEIEYQNVLTNRKERICPTDGIRECTTPEEKEKYGPYWSPWLEEQWRGLQERGQGWKFQQEILAQFAGSGNTVVDQIVLKYLSQYENNKYKIVTGQQPYVHPITNKSVTVDFNGGDRQLSAEEGLWVWKRPFIGTKPTYVGNKLVDAGDPSHNYVIGVDTATGKGEDYNAIEIFDLNEMEQAAEMMIHCLPRVLKYIIDYIGRWYNNAVVVVERNYAGDAIIDDLLSEFMYPRLWRSIKLNDKPASNRSSALKVGQYGFMTTSASKPMLNKALLDYLRSDGTGMKIYSHRLLKQLQIYVRKKNRLGLDTNKTEAESGPGNHDDLVMATGLALIGLPDALLSNSDGLTPIGVTPNVDVQPASMQDLYTMYNNDPHMLPPITLNDNEPIDLAIESQLANFAMQLGSIPIIDQPKTVGKRYGFGI